jgi:hypothetical protein
LALGSNDGGTKEGGTAKSKSKSKSNHPRVSAVAKKIIKMTNRAIGRWKEGASKFPHNRGRARKQGRKKKRN